MAVSRFSWFSSPVAAFIAFVFGIIGTGWGFASSFLNLREPNVVFAVQPAQAHLVRYGEISRLQVAYDGNPISTDIRAAQVAIWNDGNVPVRLEDVLETLTFDIQQKCLILEARVRQVSRDTIRMSATSNSNRLSISFRILEPNDGAIVQLVCACPEPIKLRSSGGAIVGQDDISEARLVEANESSGYVPKSAGQRWRNRIGASVTFSVLLFGLSGLLVSLARSVPSQTPTVGARMSRLAMKVTCYLLAAASALLATALIVFIAFGASSGPPFAF